MENGTRPPSKIPRPFSKTSTNLTQNSNSTNSNINTNETINSGSTQDLDQSAFSPFIRTPITNQSLRYSYSPLTPVPNAQSTPLLSTPANFNKTTDISNLKADVQNLLAQTSLSVLKKRKADEESESFDNLQFVEFQRKRIEDLESQNVNYEEEIRNLKILNDKLQKEATKAQMDKTLIEHQVKEKEADTAREIKKRDEISQKMKTLTKEMENLQKKLEDKTNEFEELVLSSTTKVKKLEQQKSALQDELLDAKDKISSLSTDIHSLRISSSQKETLLENEVQVLNEKVQHFESQQLQALENMKELESTREKLQSLESKVKISDSLSSRNKEDDLIIQSLKSELAHYKSIESNYHTAIRDAKAIKENVQNSEVLKEQIINLKNQLSRSDEIIPQFNELQVKYDSLLQEKKKWMELFSGLHQFDSPAHVLKTITDLQKQNEVLTAQLGTLQVELKSSKVQISSLQDENSGLRSQFTDVERLNKELKDELNLSEKQLKLWKAEIEGYKKIVQSYEGDGNQETVRSTRIEELEKLLEEKKQYIESMERKEPMQIVNSNSGDSQRFQLEIQRLNKEMDSLIATIAGYEQRLGKGDYNPQTTKILHMKVNPESQAQLKRMKNAEVEFLRAENETQRKQIQQLQQGVSIEGGPPPQKLVDEIEGLKKQNIRMKEIFTKKFTEWREVVCLLFGFKIDSTEKKQYKLKHMYAENEADHMLIQYTPQGIELLETEFTMGLSKEIHAFLSQCHSFPAFLANITMDLFNKRTFNPS